MDELVLSLLFVSAFVGLFALLLKLLSPFLNRHTAARWRYWVWLALAMRLLLPFSIPAEKAPFALTVPAPQITFAAAPVPSGISQPQAGFDTGGGQLSRPHGEENGESLPEKSVSVWQLLGLAWLGGIFITAGYQSVRGALFRRRLLRWSRPPRKNSTRELFEKERARIGASKNVTLLISQAASGSITFGLLKPVLVLPDEDTPAEDMQLILRHELTHQKRGDLWYKLVVLAAVTVHWFNPLCRLLYREASADIEQRCDDAVLAASGAAERRLYSEVILAAVQRGRPRAALTTCFYGGKKRLRLRFENILKPCPKKGGALLLAVCLTAALLPAVLVGCGAVRQAAPSLGGEDTGSNVLQDVPAGFYAVTLTFPTEEQKKTINSELLESHAFQFSVWIPENWELRPEALTKYDYAPATGYEIWEKGGHLLGHAFCDVFERVPDVPREQQYQVAYASVRLGSMVDYEDYRPVAASAFFESGICHQGYIPRDVADEYDGRMPDAPWRYNWNAMAFDIQREVFVILAVDDGETTEEEITMIAQSASFSGEIPERQEASPGGTEERDDGLLQIDFSWVEEDLYSVPAAEYAAQLKPLYKFLEKESDLFDPAAYRLTLRAAPGTPSAVSIKLVYHLAPDIATSMEYTCIFKDGLQEDIAYYPFPDLKPLTPLETLEALTQENNRALGLNENKSGAARYRYDFKNDNLYYLPFAPDSEKAVRLN